MRHNQKTSVRKQIENHPDVTTNYEGGVHFNVPAVMDLYLRCCASFFGENKYYASGNRMAEELKTALRNPEIDGLTILKLARYVRTEMHLRSVSIVMLAEAARKEPKVSGPVLRAYTKLILQRADEPGELIAYWINTFGSKAKFPNALKRGIGDALAGFSEYQLAKNNHNKASVKLKDVLRICHPRPHRTQNMTTKQMNDLYHRIIKDELATPETWETYISANGSSAETWNHIAPKMGIMALIRNLRNFLQHDAKEAMEHAITQLKTLEVIQKSKQLPYRFYSAKVALQYAGSCDNVQYHNKLLDALNTAMTLSVANIPKWEGNSAIFVDLSGSMTSWMSEKSKVTYLEVAALMGSIAHHAANNSLIGAFGETYADVSLRAADSILTNQQRIMKTQVGHSTNAFLALKSLIERKIKVDRIMVFSDMQCWDSTCWSYTNQNLAEEFKRYKAQVNPDAKMYSFDLAGYGGSQFPQDEKNVALLSGFSDKVFDFIPAFEGAEGVLDKILENY